MVRIKSILAKYVEAGGDKADVIIQFPGSGSEKGLMLSLAGFNGVIENAFDELSPHKVCAYIYELANAFNRFYHETKILTEADEDRKKSYISLISLTLGVLEKCIDVLGFEAPEKM